MGKKGMAYTSVYASVYTYVYPYVYTSGRACMIGSAWGRAVLQGLFNDKRINNYHLRSKDNTPGSRPQGGPHGRLTGRMAAYSDLAGDN